ncbi:hypothetical protein Anapl_01427 [Anas platyrhynchos]|uniref:Uncharacterized protein n=1 Tax=Anas platyrhynchos TaxID=8839 RepID=R0K465_ANAPL|nr:hypothetical protein Anapl_01427 [Anas platyrhynchos]
MRLRQYCISELGADTLLSGTQDFKELANAVCTGSLQMFLDHCMKWVICQDTGYFIHPSNHHYSSNSVGPISSTERQFVRYRLQLCISSDSSRDTTLYIPYEGALTDIYSYQDKNLPVIS